MKAAHCILFVCSILAYSFAVPNQNRSANEVRVVGPFQCQHNEAFVSGIGQNIPAKTLLIVIGRAGENETKSNLNKRRLHNVRAYLTRFTKQAADESLILAEGEKVKGYGRLEFYINGKLTAILNIRHNWDLIVGNCYPDPLDAPFCSVKENQVFYPCLDRSKARGAKGEE